MNGVPVSPAQRDRVEAFQRKHRVGVLTLFFSDMVGFARLKQELGDTQAHELVQAHHDAVRQILAKYPEGEEIDTAGDAFFIVFAKPSDSLRFSLELQAANRQLSRTTPRPIQDRIGIHAGEVVITETPAEKDLFGLHVDTAARIMGLGDGDQVLMSRFVFDNARQALKGQDVAGLGPLAWLSHGDYVLKGVDEPMEVCEVGETGLAVLKAPGDSEKAHRHAGSGELVLGWRPAAGQKVPGSQWVLEEKLGEGGFGEVWVGTHERLKEKRVFKFCFRADRVRSLKREVTLFRILKERVGVHPGLVTVHDVFMDEAPYYLVTEYVPGQDLRRWHAERGKEGRPVTEAEITDLVAQAADALQAAHDAGVIHRDIKPSNILVVEEEGKLTVKLSDFGIGQVVSKEVLGDMTRLGFSATLVSPGSTQGGTPLYLAPEVVAGQPATLRSDVYSLGVVLFQLLVGDLACPVTVDWDRHLEDQLLREDLRRCFAGNPDDRFPKARLLAASLRGIHKRRTAHATDARAEQTKRRMVGVARHLLAFLTLLLVGVLVWALLALTRERRTKLHGSISIISDPPQAQVWAGDRQIGTTPYQVSGLPRGDATYRLTATHYDPQTVTIAVVPGSRTIFLAMLRPTHLSPSNSAAVSASVPVEPRLTMIEGKVEVCRRSERKWSQGVANQQLANGDQIRTGLRSHAVIQLAHQHPLRIGECSLLTICTNRTLMLEEGRLIFQSGTSNVVETPNVVSETRG